MFRWGTPHLTTFGFDIEQLICSTKIDVSFQFYIWMLDYYLLS